jgi:chaperone modulatory protein CbpM
VSPPITPPARPARVTVRAYPLVRAPLVTFRRLDLESFSRAAGLHPDLVRRLVALGLIEAERDPAGALRLHPGQLAAVARIQRLRAGFALNYAAVGVVVDLLDRIAELEAALRKSKRTNRRTGGRTWT